MDRKVVVPVPPDGFFVPFVPISLGMPIEAEVINRQSGEDPYIETFITDYFADVMRLKPPAAVKAQLVCYHHTALVENNGIRSTPAEWEIVAVLASLTDEEEPMTPLTMARNFLEKPGGTKTEYTAFQFAEAIYANSTTRTIRIRNVKRTEAELKSRIDRLTADLFITRQELRNLRRKTARELEIMAEVDAETM